MDKKRQQIGGKSTEFGRYIYEGPISNYHGTRKS